MKPLKGVILVDKPTGITSFDVIRKIRKKFNLKKIGHTGTLDPLATGLLILCLNKSTKLIPYLMGLNKVYEFEIEFGIRTDTLDITGEVLKTSNIIPDIEEIKKVISQLKGEYSQKIPIYSAIKYKGKPFYKYARENNSEILPEIIRKVFIDFIELIKYNYPILKLTGQVSKGTYIRALGDDIGEKLKCGGTIKSLNRVMIGNISIKKSMKLEKILELESVEDLLINENEIMNDYPSINIKNFDIIDLLEKGKMLKFEYFEDFQNDSCDGIYRVIDKKNTLLALIKKNSENLKYERVLI